MMVCNAMHFATGTRTRVARVRAEYPNQLDYSGLAMALKMRVLLQTCFGIELCSIITYVRKA